MNPAKTRLVLTRTRLNPVSLDPNPAKPGARARAGGEPNLLLISALT